MMAAKNKGAKLERGRDGAMKGGRDIERKRGSEGGAVVKRERKRENDGGRTQA